MSAPDLEDPLQSPLYVAARHMRDHARRGEVDATMKYLLEVEKLSGSSLTMSVGPQRIIETIQKLRGAFWALGCHTLPDNKMDWQDPAAVFCHHVIPLVRAASSSGNISLMDALAHHGVYIEALGWTMITGPAVMQRKKGLLEWAIKQGADPTGRARSYDTSLTISNWSDMQKAPLLLACERGWKEGVAMMMGGKRDPEDFWARVAGNNGAEPRLRWIVMAASDLDMAKWLIARHEGPISKTMQARIKTEIKKVGNLSGKRLWLNDQSLDNMIQALILRQKMQAEVPDVISEDEAIAPRARGPRRI